MTYPKRTWEIVPECNDEQDNPCCWGAASVEDSGKAHFIWVVKYAENDYRVEDSLGINRAGENKTFKTLGGAKRAAEGILWRQEETGTYSD